LSTAWIALLLGVVEGITEFLPISSTGHLVLAGHLVGFQGKRAEVFEVFIQLGAILAVVWEYRTPLQARLNEVGRSPASRRFFSSVALAFVPSGLLGFFLHAFISEHLFRPTTVAAALIAGAVAILLVESRDNVVRTHDPAAVTIRQALLIGLAQCVSLWPGFSRSAATILGGLLVGLDRRSATEFSFYLAIPTMVAASAYNLLVYHRWLRSGDGVWLGVSFGVSFVVALASIRWLVRFVSSHDLRPFAWYRLALGAIVLLLVD
jgi:undecaprenyl-diphosphatase